MYIREGKSISTFNSNQVFFHQNFWKIWEMMFHTKGIFFCFCWKIRVIKVFSSKLSKKFVKSVSFSSKPSKNSWNQFFSSKLSLFTLWNESTQNSKIHFDVKTKKKNQWRSFSSKKSKNFVKTIFFVLSFSHFLIFLWFA